MATEVGSIFVDLGLDTSSLQEGVQEAQSTLDGMSRQLQQTGKALTAAITAPAAAAGAASVKAAGDFEESFSRIEGLVGLAGEQVQGFKSEVLALSEETAQSPRELADALFFVTSAGLEGEQAISALEASAKAAAAGLGTTRTVADAATSAMNAYGADTLSAAEATDVLTATVREGKVEPEELAGSLGKVIPTASAVGVEFDQVGAAMAAMTRQGANARRATTALNSLLTQIQKPSADAKETLSQVGLSMEQLRQRVEEDGLLAVMNLLQNEFEGNTEALTSLFGNVRAMRAALQLTGESAEEARDIFGELEDTTGATDDAFEQAKSTFNFRFKQLRTATERLRIELGNRLLPAVTDLVQASRDLIDTWDGLAQSTKNTVIQVTALAAALGPVLFITGKLVGAVSSVIGALSGLGAALGAISVPISGVVAGVFAIGAAAATIITNWQAVADFFGPFFSTLADLGRATGRVIGNFFQFIAQKVVGLFESIIQEVGGGISSLAQSVGLGGIAQSIDTATGSLVEFGRSVDETKQAGREAMGQVGTAASQLGSDVGQMASDTISSVTSMVTSARNKITGLFSLGSGMGGGSVGSEEDTQTPSGQVTPAPTTGGDSLSQDISNLERAGPSMERLNRQAARAKANVRQTSQLGQQAGNVLTRSFSQAASGVGNFVGGLVTGENSLRSFAQVGKQMIQQVISQLTSLAVKLAVIAPLMTAIGLGGGGVAAPGIVGQVGAGIFPGAASGGFVEEGGLARIHEGETIVPASISSGMGNLKTGEASIKGDTIEIPARVVNDSSRIGSRNKGRAGRA